MKSTFRIIVITLLSVCSLPIILIAQPPEFKKSLERTWQHPYDIIQSRHQKSDDLFPFRSREFVNNTSDDVKIAWTRHYSSQLAPSWERAGAIACDYFGNVFVAGQTTNYPNGTDLLIVKYDTNGNEMWTATYNGDGNHDDLASSVGTDDAGNVYVTGWCTGLGTGYDCVTLKYDGLGNRLWAVDYNGVGNANDMLFAIALDDSGNVFVTGETTTEYGEADFLTIKYNTSGELLWVVTYNGLGNKTDYASAICVDHLGNSYVAGTSEGSGTYLDYITIKYNSNGIPLWEARYNGTGNGYDYARSIAIDSAMNVYVTGEVTTTSDNSDFGTIKYTAQGVEQWVALYNGKGNKSDWALKIIVDSSGSVYVIGESNRIGIYFEYALVKYNADGIQQWVNRYSDSNMSNTHIQDMSLDYWENIIVTGYNYPSGDNTKCTTIKYDTHGNELWNVSHISTENWQDYMLRVATDLFGNVYLTGYRRDYHDRYDDIITMKYDWSGTEQWVSIFDGSNNNNDEPLYIATDRYSNIYICGQSIGKNSGLDYITIQYDSSGKQKWVARYNGPGNAEDHVSAIATDGNGNIYIAGSSAGTASDYDYATVKYDVNGVQQWVARYDDLECPSGHVFDIDVDCQGNIFVTGYNSCPHSVIGRFTTIKYDPNGIKQWIAQLINSNLYYSNVMDITTDNFGKVYLIISGNCSFGIIKYNSQGHQCWIKHFIEIDNEGDLPYKILCDQSGNIVVTGYGHRQNEVDIITIKVNPAGDLQWVARYDDPSDKQYKYVSDMSIDANNCIYIYGSTLIKYDPHGSVEWIKKDIWNDIPHIYHRRIALDIAGNIYILGYSDYLESKHHLGKFTPDGTNQWFYSYTGFAAEAFLVNRNGDIYVTGSNSGTSWSIASTVKYVQKSTGITTPANYQLAQNYPNPFYYATCIRYQLPKTEHVTMKIFNLLGQEVETVINSMQQEGVHHISWGGDNVPPGVYFYQLEISDFKQVKKLVKLRY